MKQKDPQAVIVEFGCRLKNKDGHHFILSGQTFVRNKAGMCWACHGCKSVVICSRVGGNDSYLVETFINGALGVIFYSGYPIVLPALVGCGELKMRRALM